MYNLQADGLSKALLKSNNPKLLYFAFEPMQIRKNSINPLEAGELIELGKKLPVVYVYKKGIVVGQAELGVRNSREVAVISAKERMVNLGKPEPKHIALEVKIAILPKSSFTVGKIVDLPINSMENLLIFAKGKLIAKASLRQSKKVYYLKILELY